MNQKNNSFVVTGKVFGDWELGLNPSFDERYLYIQTTDPLGKYTNEIKILVSGKTCKYANMSFNVSPDGYLLEIRGYINGRYYRDTGKHFQTLKASYITVKSTTSPKGVEMSNQDIENEEINEVEFDDDDLPF